MHLLLLLGLIILSAFLLGQLMKKIGLPKITGYILAGIVFNPDLAGFTPADFPRITEPITDVCLAFITFEVGGSLLFSKIRSAGKAVISMTLFEGLGAFLLVAVLVYLLLVFSGQGAYMPAAMMIPFALLIATMAAPTDPSATLAVEHEYQAKGAVTDTILEVAAFDDALGIILFNLGLAAALILSGNGEGSLLESGGLAVLEIVGALSLGLVSGFIFNKLTGWFRLQAESSLIVVILGWLIFTYGIAQWIHFDALLCSMALGFTVVNFNKDQEKIFGIVQRYTEELIFLFFFALSAMHLAFDSLLTALPIIGVFIVARAMGKFTGTYAGGKLAGVQPKVRKFTAGGLIPQGGIVIGLALLVQKKEAFGDISDLLISVIMGATLIHEFIGPLVAKFSLKKAGEITARR